MNQSAESIRRFLAGHSESLLGSLSHASLDELIAIAETITVPPGTRFISQGEAGDCFYLILSGQVCVFTVSEDGLKTVLNRLGPGEGIGEMALLTDQPRSASVETVDHVEMLRIAKKPFDAILASNSSLLAEFMKILCERLVSSNTKMATAWSKEMAYQRLVSEQAARPVSKLVGHSKAYQRLMNRIELLAAERSPVYLFGQPGTEKGSAAACLHAASGVAEGPFLRMDAKTVTLQTADAEQPSGKDPVHRELAQKSMLFGHEKGAFPFAESRRLGLMQVADQGTVLIENIEYLGSNLQHELLAFLNTGSFQPLGAQTSVHASSRIVASSSLSPEELHKGQWLHPQLYAQLCENNLEIPPLKKRKRDLRLITDQLIRRYNELNHSTIQGIDQEAFNRIMSYDWPGNMDELEATIRRAVNLAKDDVLHPEDIFFGLPPLSGKLNVNLLSLDKVKAFFQSPWFPGLGQGIAALFFVLVLGLGFFGSPEPQKNASLVLVWGLWEPMIIASLFFTARMWCAVCPLGAVNGLTSRYLGLRKKVPPLLRRHGLVFSAAGLGLIVWAEAGWEMHRAPLATALLISAILIGAFATGLLFQKRAWCRYLCPLGGLVGVLARCSCVEMRANQSLCNNECREHTCCRTGEDHVECPMFEAPFSQQTNQDCILCGSCVKHCPRGAPLLNLRFPGYELGAVRKPSRFMAVFLPILFGTQLYRGLYAQGGTFEAVPDSSGLIVQGLLLGLSCGLALLFTRAAAENVFQGLSETGLSKGDLFLYSLVPLAYGVELGFQLKVFALLSGGLLIRGGDWSQQAWDASPLIIGLQLVLLAAGLLLASHVLDTLGRRHQLNQGPVPWSRKWPLVLFTLVFAWLLTG